MTARKYRPHVWVVEMWNWQRARWEPCSACSIMKDVRLGYDRMRQNNPNDRFRVAKYLRAKP